MSASVAIGPSGGNGRTAVADGERLGAPSVSRVRGVPCSSAAGRCQPAGAGSWKHGRRSGARGCRRCPNPFPDYYTQARRLISGMEELATLAGRLDSGHDLEAYCNVLTFGMFGPGGSSTGDTHRLLRKPHSALGAARDRLAERHADAYRSGKAQEELLLIGAAALLDSDFRRRRPGKFRLPWQETWEEICEEALDAQEGKDTFSGTARYDYQSGFDRWCEKWLHALMRLTPAEQNNHASPAAARWARAYDALERAVKRDLQDEPWVVRLADQLHHTGRGLVTGIARPTPTAGGTPKQPGGSPTSCPWHAQTPPPHNNRHSAPRHRGGKTTTASRPAGERSTRAGRGSLPELPTPRQLQRQGPPGPRSGPIPDQLPPSGRASFHFPWSAWVQLLYQQQTKNLLVSYSPKKLGFFWAHER